MALALVITTAGRAALRNADGSGTRAVRIAAAGVSAAALSPTAATAALPGEIKRIATLSGDAVAADTIHLVVRDETMATYTVRAFALYLDDGTLFAAYGQADPIIEKSAQALLLLSLDVTLADITAGQITFGDANFLMPPATVERQGLIELATLAEARASTDPVRAVTPATAKQAVVDWIGYTPVRQGTGIGQLRNAIAIGYDGARIRATVDFTDYGPLVFDSNIANVWRASNDGAGSGLDADMLDGQQGSWYGDIPARLGYTPVRQGTGEGQLRNAIAIGYDGARIRATVDFTDYGPLVFDSNIANVWRASNDGAGSGLDADMLDGQQGSWYADIRARLGFAPVQQGGGIGQLTNVVKVGWSGTRLKATIDASDLGSFVFDDNVADVWRSSNDGAGSGLDADMLDGRQAAEFALLSGATFTGPVYLRDVYARDLVAGRGDGTGVLYLNEARSRWLQYDGAEYQLFGARLLIAGSVAWTAGNDGTGSGMDADLLDGQQGSWYADIRARLGFSPVQQGGGAGQSTNVVKIGWGGTRLKATVDASDLGSFVFDDNVADVWRSSNDGAGSGLDADMLDGRDGDWYRRWANLLDVPGAFPPSGHAHGAADLAGAFAGSLAENGYTVLPNGLILQWTTGPMQAARTSAATYMQWPIAFPTACFQAFVSAQMQQAGDRGDSWFQLVGAPDQNGATIQRQASGTADDIVASAPRIFAIGM